jgi:hypothetical protein
LILDGLHCPLTAAVERFLCIIKLPAVVQLLDDAQPLFFPMGEQLAGQVLTTAGPVY